MLFVGLECPVIKPAAGRTNPDFIHDGFASAATPQADGTLRSWQMPSILTNIISIVRDPNDP